MKPVNLLIVVEQGEKTINYIFGGKTTVEDMLEVIQQNIVVVGFVPVDEIEKDIIKLEGGKNNE